MSSIDDYWSEERLEGLYKAKIFVEDRLRCVRDDYFYELLHERWTKIHPDSGQSPEELKMALTKFESQCLVASVEEKGKGLQSKTSAHLSPPLFPLLSLLAAKTPNWETCKTIQPCTYSCSTCQEWNRGERADCV